LYGTHQLLIYADVVNVVCGTIHSIKKNTETIVVASKETGLELNAWKTKYIVMFQDQHAGQNNNIKIGN
jgi:hypothetical protein